MSDWSCSNCGWVNREISESCLSCGAPKGAVPASTTEEPWQATPPSPQLVFADPLPFVAPGPTPWFRTDGLLGGLAVAVLAAVVASAVWYAVVTFSSYQIGFVAIGVGWVIGTGAVIGARGRGSIWLAAASMLLTLVALGVSEYLISYHFITQEFGLALDLIQPPDVVVSVIVEVLAADPLTLAFWGFALVAAAYVPFKAILSASD